MKKLLFGLLLAAIAVGGSSFTREKRVVIENFFIQTDVGVFRLAVTANGSCINLNSGFQCKYAITDLGRPHIPTRMVYLSDDIQEYLDEGWIERTQGAPNGIYFLL